MPAQPILCPISVNGIPVLVSVYPTTDPTRLPERHRSRADLTRDGRALFVAEAEADPVNGQVIAAQSAAAP